jgi:hypothetical protein
MPRRRGLPDALGIVRSRTGSGRNLPALRSSRSPRRNPSRPASIEAGFTPSTPAVRAPRLPRTRSHATVRKAGSATRLNRSQNRFGSFERRPRSAGVHRRPPDVPGSLLLARWVPLPCGRLSRPRTTTDPPPRPGAIGRQRALPPPPQSGGGEAAPGWFPRSPCVDRRDGRPALPLQHRHEYAAGAPRGLPTDCIRSASESPAASSRPACAASRPGSTRFVPVSRLRGFDHWFTLVTPLRLARRARAVWWCRPAPPSSGLLPPSPALPGSGCPRLRRAAATARRRSPFISARSHGASWRQCRTDAHVLPGKVRLVSEPPNPPRGGTCASSVVAP